MTDEPWDKPSEKLRRIAEAKEPEIKPMTEAEKARIVNPSQQRRDDDDE